MKIKLIKKLKKWFNDEILSKYLLEFHPTFLDILNNDKPRFDSVTEKTRKKYERIMMILKSPKYQRMLIIKWVIIIRLNMIIHFMGK